MVLRSVAAPREGCKNSSRISEQDLQSSRSDADILDRFDVVIDEAAAPVDFDEVLADFLLGIVEKRRAARQTSPCRSGRSDARLGMLEAATGGTQ